MLFVMRSIVFPDFKYPIALLKLSKHLDGKRLFDCWHYVLEPLTRLGQFKLRILAVISDGVSGSEEARRLLKARFGIGHISDLTHNLKTLWRGLINASPDQAIFTPVGPASNGPLWTLLNVTGDFLSPHPRLKSRALKPSPKEKMSVHLALVVISEKTLNGLEHVNHPHVNCTKWLIRTILEFWRIFNDRTTLTEGSFEEKQERSRVLLEKVTNLHQLRLDNTIIIRAPKRLTPLSTAHMLETILAYSIENGEEIGRAHV